MMVILLRFLYSKMHFYVYQWIGFHHSGYLRPHNKPEEKSLYLNLEEDDIFYNKLATPESI